MCRLQNIAMQDYQKSVTTGQTDARQSDPYVPLCFAGDTKINQIVDKYTPYRNYELSVQVCI